MIQNAYFSIKCFHGFCRAAFAAAVLLFAACTEPAEHSNPLDPQSPFYSTKGSIDGRVMTFYQPFRPLAEVMVTLEPGGTTIKSDANGLFRFADLDPDTFTIALSTAGFDSIVDTVVVAARQISSRDYHLNGLPFVQQSRVISSRVATREAAAARLFLEVSADVQDPDGANDIRRVEWSIPSQAFPDTLAPATVTGPWQRFFVPEELAALDFGKLVGAPFHLSVEDFPGANVTSPPFFLARIIFDEPQATAPIDGQTTGNAPTFRWQVPNLPFSYTQRLEVFRFDAGFPTLVTAIGNIQSEVKSLP